MYNQNPLSFSCAVVVLVSLELLGQAHHPRVDTPARTTTFPAEPTLPPHNYDNFARRFWHIARHARASLRQPPPPPPPTTRSPKRSGVSHKLPSDQTAPGAAVVRLARARARSRCGRIIGVDAGSRSAGGRGGPWVGGARPRLHDPAPTTLFAVLFILSGCERCKQVESS